MKKRFMLFVVMMIIISSLSVYAEDIIGVEVIGETLSMTGSENIQYPEYGLGRVEAEDMYTAGYYIVNNDNASGGKYIKAYANQTERNGVWSVAAFKYTGGTAKCTLNITYPDFYSGASTKQLYINGERIAIWSGKLTYGTSVWGTTPEYTNEVIKTKSINDVMLKDGDIISFVSKPDYGEYGELDYIEIVRGSGGGSADKSEYIDIDNDINKDKINTLLEKEITTLGEDKCFYPERQIKCDELIVMLLRLLGYKNIDQSNGYWADGYINKLESMGYVPASIDFSQNATDTFLKDIIEKIEYTDYSFEASGEYLTRSSAAGHIYDFYEYLELKKSEQIGDKASVTEYELDDQNYIKTWLYTGGVITHIYEGSDDLSVVMPTVMNTPFDVTIPDENNFSQTLDNGMDFNVLPMGNSGFIYELLRGGDPQPGFMVSYACSDIIAEEDMTVDAKIMGTRGYYEIYLNGERITDLYWFWTRSTDKTFKLQLKEGTNRLFIRIQNVLGNIITTNVGIQISNNTDKIKTTVPAQKEILSALSEVEEWTYDISIAENGALKAATPPKEGAIVMIGNKNYDWPLYSDTFDIKREIGENITTLKLKSKVGQNYLERAIEIPQNYEMTRTEFTTLEEHQANYRKKVLENEVKDWDWSEYVLLRLNEGYELSDKDIERIRTTITDSINPMSDCSEFAMTHLLRLYMLYGDTFPEDLKAEVKDCILNFGYFSDEEGTASMVVTSENHKIGFYTCQYIAGSLYPDEIFTRSGRTGAQQMEVARTRLNEWLTKVETEGFEEFSSPDYMDITLNAMLNGYDFIDDASFKQRFKNLIDLALRTAAIMTFDGVAGGANGRVYAASLMYPMKSEKSKILSYLSPSMNFCEYTQQILGLATSTYVPPADLEDLITGNVDLSYQQGGTQLTVKKTDDYIISSCAVPTPAQGTLAANFGKGLLLYQTHLWEVSVGAMAKVFVTHPGSTSEASTARPGYWFGEYCAPVICQKDNMVAEIYNIPEDNGITFTHAYFTTDSFDETQIGEHWLFGKKDNGYVALWCSSPLESVSDLTIGIEYRANALKTAWVCFASSADESGSFEEFIAECQNKNIQFDETKLKLMVDDSEVLSW